MADIENALRFIERNTRTAYRIEELKRQNIPEYPMKALREAITNAVMHRDWFLDGANVFVEIYTARIEVVSPGSLPKGVTLADLGRKSVRRNALVSDLLHRIDFVEKAGTGIRRIRDRGQRARLPRTAVRGQQLRYRHLPTEPEGSSGGRGTPDESSHRGSHRGSRRGSPTPTGDVG